MAISRRTALRILGAAPLAARMALGQTSPVSPAITAGPFQGTYSSLTGYTIPEWFPRAKFGIWSHWGPQSAIEDGDWYARNLYLQGSPENLYHTEAFGHPSRIGYKDLIPLYTASRWDPDALIDLYVKAGAKYFFSMGVHHDNYDLWNSRFQPRWNAVASGPKRDIVAGWRDAARRRGLRFGVSEHLSNSYDWFAPAHGSDATGPMAGVPYDGANPAYADLYHDLSQLSPAEIRGLKDMGRVAPERFKQHYFARVKDLIDQHQPDLLYTDGAIPFEQHGLGLVAELYNVSAHRNGSVQAVYLSKRPEDTEHGVSTLDMERGVPDIIWPSPWQTDSCIGNWHFKRGIRYKSAKDVVDLLVDVVSKNGNLLLNLPLPASGELDYQARVTLSGFTAWMTVNSEGIYDSTPWHTYGEGPSTRIKLGGGFNEDKRGALTADDIRFTTKGHTLYAFVQGWPPSGRVTINSLGTASSSAARIEHVAMLGGSPPLTFDQGAQALTITLPASQPETASIGITLKLSLA